jgi:hypothetical protein
MINKRLFLTAGHAGFVLGSAFLVTLTGCVG